MIIPIVLASGSEIRRTLLANAGLEFEVKVPDVDEVSIRGAMLAQGKTPAQVALSLAAAKARQVSLKNPDALVIGSDQLLECGGELFAKPTDQADALQQLQKLVNRSHHLICAVAVCQNGQITWDTTATAKMHMRNPSPRYLSGYVDRNWQSIRHSVGCYKLEEEGVRLFTQVEGDYFAVLGLPLIELLGHLTTKGVLAG